MFLVMLINFGCVDAEHQINVEYSCEKGINIGSFDLLLYSNFDEPYNVHYLCFSSLSDFEYFYNVTLNLDRNYVHGGLDRRIKELMRKRNFTVVVGYYTFKNINFYETYYMIPSSTQIYSNWGQYPNVYKYWFKDSE